MGDFDVISFMDWLNLFYASLDYRTHLVVFRFLENQLLNGRVDL